MAKRTEIAFIFEKIPIPEDHLSDQSILTDLPNSWWSGRLLDLGHARDLRWIALRYFNAGGADPDAEIGEAHDPEPHLIPRVLAAARDGTAVTIYGMTMKRRMAPASAITSMWRILPMHMFGRSTTCCQGFELRTQFG